MINPFVPLLLLPLLPWFAEHPHDPQALIVQGAAGTTTVTYFTVPYNEEHLEGLKEGFEWHLGFADLRTAVPLELPGEVQVPVGEYKMGVVRGASDAEWDLLLEPLDVWRANIRANRARRSGRNVEATEKALKEAIDRCKAEDIPTRITAVTGMREMPAAEHLEMEVGLRGYATTQRFGTEPKAGMRFTLRLDFGGLHRVIDMRETFAPKKDG